MIISCLLLKMLIRKSPNEVLALFANRRTTNERVNGRVKEQKVSSTDCPDCRI